MTPQLQNTTSTSNRIFGEPIGHCPKARFETGEGSSLARIAAEHSKVAVGSSTRDSRIGGFAMKQEEVLEKVDNALSDLEQALAKGNSETLKNYLRFLGRFHHYSFCNLLLIYFQAPNASLVAGFRKWQDMGRHVKKGEKAIRILAPLVRKVREATPEGEQESRRVYGFRVVSVFDMAQTDGDAVPEIRTYGGDPAEHLSRLEAFTMAKGIDLQWQTPDGGAKGVSRGGSILVDPNQSDADKFATLVHEVAHELLHKGDRRSQTNRSLRETEAEAVAFAVCSAVGLDAGDAASDYIQLYQGDVEKLKASLDYIRDAAAEILDALSSETAELLIAENQ